MLRVVTDSSGETSFCTFKLCFELGIEGYEAVVLYKMSGEHSDKSDEKEGSRNES